MKKNPMFFLLAAAALIPSAVSAETTCPDAIYSGSLTISFADENLSDQIFENMVFFYGKKYKEEAGKNTLQLKSIMICTGTHNQIDIVTKYLGKYNFSMQGECDLYLNGGGTIEDDTLLDKGAVKLHCKDNLVYAGEYTIQAEQLQDK